MHDGLRRGIRRLRDQRPCSRWWRLQDVALLESVGNATFAQVVGGHFEGDAVTGEDADVVFTHLA